MRGLVLNEVYQVLGVIVTVISMILCPIIAHQKKRSTIGWFFLGFLLGGIGIVIISCLPSKE